MLRKWAIREQAEHTSLTSNTEMQNTLGLTLFPRKRDKSLFYCPPTHLYKVIWKLRGRQYRGYRTIVTRRTCVLYAQVFLKTLPLNPLIVLRVTSPRPHNMILHCTLLSYLRWYGYLVIWAALPKLLKQFSLSYRHINQGERRLQRADKNLFLQRAD